MFAPSTLGPRALNADQQPSCLTTLIAAGSRFVKRNRGQCDQPLFLRMLLANALGTVQPVMTSVSNVTAPLRGQRPASRFMPVIIVIDVSARMFPLNTEFVPRIAELPTCQKTLKALAQDSSPCPAFVGNPSVIGLRKSLISRRQRSLSSSE